MKTQKHYMQYTESQRKVLLKHAEIVIGKNFWFIAKRLRNGRHWYDVADIMVNLANTKRNRMVAINNFSSKEKL